jgi:hypothetical protein
MAVVYGVERTRQQQRAVVSGGAVTARVKGPFGLGLKSEK